MKATNWIKIGLACAAVSAQVQAQQFVDDERRGGSSSFEDSLGSFYETQDRMRVKVPFEKMHPDTRREFAALIEQSRLSTAKIYKGDYVKALGTVVAKEGLLITKASEIEDDAELAVELLGKEKMTAELIEVNEENDLALLWVHDFNLTPVTWAPGSELPVGSLMATSGTHTSPLAIGTVSLPLRNLSERNKGFLGVGILPAEDGSGLFVDLVSPGMGAERAGVKRGDKIQAIDGLAMKTNHDLINTVSEGEPGDTVVLQILRDEEKMMVEVTLGDRDTGMGFQDPMHEQLDNTARMGGRVSRKRSGYPAAIQHDMLLTPTQCGSPLVNLDGHTVGVNIARASRVKSYAIPSDVIQDWLGDPKKLAETVLKTRVKNAESARLAAEEALEKAQSLEMDVQGALDDLEAQRAAAEVEAIAQAEAAREAEAKAAEEAKAKAAAEEAEAAAEAELEADDSVEEVQP